MDRLLALWQRHVAGSSRRRAVTDALLVGAVGLLVFALQLGPFFTSPPWREAPAWWHLVLLAAGCSVMLAKFATPALSLAAGVLLFVADVLIGGSLGTILVLIDLLYTFALVGSAAGLRRVIVAVGVLVVASTTAGWLLVGEFRAGIFFALQTFALLGTPLWWGRSIRQQRELTELEAARARDQLHLATMRQEDALRDEREQVARDLHDAVAGHLSAVALRSEVGLLHADEGSRAGESLAAVRSSSLEALTEMRAMIQVLRGTTPERAPGRLGEQQARKRLAAQHEARYEGPNSDLDLPAETDQAAYRIAQEALTNATKHGDQPLTLTIRQDKANLKVVVRNAVVPENHHGAPTEAANAGAGLGLAIMAERAEAVGGTFRAGLLDGAWQARAVLPIRDRVGLAAIEGKRN